MSNQPQAHVADEREWNTARAIFRIFKPANMVDADWDNGLVLGGADDFRKKCLAAARAAIPAGADVASTWSMRREQDRTLLIDHAGEVIGGAVCPADIQRIVDRHNSCLAAGAPAETPKAAPITLMTERQAQDWAWKQVKIDCGLEKFSIGETIQYFSFFLHGWNYKTQYDKQRPAAQPAPAPATDAMRDVLVERQRQVEQEGWKPERDDRYIDCELARAASTYALCTSPEQLRLCDLPTWPWPLQWWKPTDYRRNLVKAGALLIAEIERIDRAAMLSANSPREAG